LVTSISPPDSLLVGFPATIALQVLDSIGNFIPSVPVSFSVTAGEGAFDSATVLTDRSGRVSVEWTLGAPGENAALATVKGGPTVTFAETALDPSIYTWYDLQLAGVCVGNLRASMIGLGPNGQLVTLDEYVPNEDTDPIYMLVGQYTIVGDSVRLNKDGFIETAGFQNDRITLRIEDCDDRGTTDWIYLKRGTP
ncbi:MAG: Ig-like domain-containing protein, partial [Gemmatimonadaceae bacterium]